MAYGRDPMKFVAQTTNSSSLPRQIDRFDECNFALDTRVKNMSFAHHLVVDEVEQRKKFLDQMTALGKRKDYQEVIMIEIADVRSSMQSFSSK